MISLLGLLQNLNKVSLLKLFFFYDPANVRHPDNLSYNSIHEEFSRTHTIQASYWSVYRRRNGSRKRNYFTNQSVSKYWSRGLGIIKPVKNENPDYSTNLWVMGIFQNTIVRVFQNREHHPKIVKLGRYDKSRTFRNVKKFQNWM